MVEFALVLVIFVLVTVGLIDGLRVIFYFSQIQEAARAGARWGAVEVGRAIDRAGTQTPWGTFADPGNYAATYCATCADTVTGSRTLANGNRTIVGSVTAAMNAVDPGQATITIVTGIGGGSTADVESNASMTNAALTNKSISVSVQYPFRPILMSLIPGLSVTLHGTSSMLHE